ncbi:MAG: cell envelope integrity protein CreD [Flavobacteriia bacterium]
MKELFQNVFFKMFVILVLILLLIIPTVMVQELIDERTQRQQEVVNEVSSKHALSQTVAGPILTIPYRLRRNVYNKATGKTEMISEQRMFHILPDELKINGNVHSESRKRGLFEVIVYQSDVNIASTFKSLPLEKLNVPIDQFDFDKAFLTLGISDLKGLSEQVRIQVNDSSFTCNPGVLTDEVISSGLHVNVPIKEDQGLLRVSCKLDLKGSQQLMFVPIGKETTVELHSDWKDPSFSGEFIPHTRSVNEKGFDARWKVLNLNRNFPQEWSGSRNIEQSAFGVEMNMPVDVYQKATRVAKYAMLFIVLTFLVFFFVEVINRILIHPIQYILVGIALILFYVLMLALSEQIYFNAAYLLASFMTIGLIYFYARTILGSQKLGLLTAAILLIMYLFIFVIIQMQDYALLFGSFGVFLILGVTMYFSRQVDWFDLKKGE